MCILLIVYASVHIITRYEVDMVQIKILKELVSRDFYLLIDLN